MYRRKRLGVFVSHIYGDYQRRLCAGIIQKADEYGYQTEIFTSNDGEDVGDYGLGEYSLFRIPDPGRYDGVLLASGTYRMKEMTEEITKLLKSRFDCPVVAIEQTASPFPRVMLENNSAVKELTLHLGRAHGYTRMRYLGDSSHPDFNDLRQRFFLEGLSALGLPSEGCVLSCDGTQEDISLVLSGLLDQEAPPQAIVCYNDALALSVIDFLRARGIQVPGQIAVTGVDALTFGQQTSPVLTSVTFPIRRLGETAVELFAAISRGETVPAVTQVYASPSIGGSCGCAVSAPPDAYAYTRLLDKTIAFREKEMIQDMRMAANLQGVEDLDKGMDLIADFVKRLPRCRRFYLCLYDGWDQMPGRLQKLLAGEQPHDCDTVFLKLAIRDGKRLPECTFSRRDTLPDYLYEDGIAFVYTSLFFGTQHFGYLALSFDEDRVGYDFAFVSWLFNVNNLLKSLWDKKNLRLLADRLEALYARDELTGLLNRQGFLRLCAPVLEQAAAERRPICAMVFHLEDFGHINDAFGRREGDFALRVLAQALENSVGETCLCARYTQDQFYLLAPDSDEQAARQIVQKVNKYLDNYNRLHARDYCVRARAGYSVRPLQSPGQLSELFQEARQAMYGK